MAVLDSAKSRTIVTTLAYAAALALVVAATVTGVKEVLPPFLIAGTGSTVIRKVIQGTAVSLLVTTALIVLVEYTESRAEFLRWYALGLVLMAVNAFGNLFLTTFGTPFNWVLRGAQLMAGIYLTVAAATIMREARRRRRPMGEVIAEFAEQARVNYEALVNAASDAIVAVDGLGRVVMWNPAAVRMFGYAQSEANGMLFFNLLTKPETMEERHDVGSSGPLMDGRPHVTVEMRGRRRNGEEFPIELTMAKRGVASSWLSSSSSSSSAAAAFTTLVVRDISERKKTEGLLRESEEKYRLLFENMTQSMRWTPSFRQNGSDIKKRVLL